MNQQRTSTVLLPLGLIAALILSACGGDGGTANGSSSGQDNGSQASAPSTIPQPSQARLDVSGLGDLPVAPQSARVDVAAPTFSDPTNITNPLFPISELPSAIFSGAVDGGKAFHTETTLLPETRFIEWAPGQVVEARVSQYFAYIDGRIEEAALDFYAQADDGSVWYLGEEVNDYNEDGFVDSREGTWLTPVDLTRIDTNLQSLRESVYDSDFGAAQEAATELRGLLAKVEPAS